MKNKVNKSNRSQTGLTVLTVSLLTALAVSFTACENFFSNDAPSAMDAKAVFSNLTYTEQAMCGAYQELAMDKGYNKILNAGYVGLNTDCEWSAWGPKSNDQSKVVLYSLTADATTAISDVSKGSDSWSMFGTIIERCNNIIEGIQQYGDTTDIAFRYYLGEAYFLRSFAYLEMIKYWGDVPARFTSLANDPQSVDAPKADRNIIYDHLRMDLNEAARLMPWANDEGMPSKTRNNVGRANKAAALALLARADLMYAGFAVRPTTLHDPTGCSIRPNIEDDHLRQEVLEEVLTACAAIINHEDKLAPDFATPFRQICQDVNTYSQMEHLWVIPFDNSHRGQVMGFNAAPFAKEVAGQLPHISAGAKSNGHMSITPYLLHLFDKNDARLWVTCTPGKWTYDAKNKNLPSGSQLYQSAQTVKNFYLGKYRYEWMLRNCIGDDGVDFPIIRYADVLLMFAEAAIGSNTGITPANNTGLNPQEQFNRVRRRAGLQDAALDFEAIKIERAKEFCGEYIRKWDLMRWGILKEEVTKAETYVRSLVDEETPYWFTYRQDAALNNAYVIDQIDIWNDGTIDHTGWIKKSDMYGSGKSELSKSNYPFYVDVQNLENRQYWPIFRRYVTASNGNLWNNYGY